MRWKYLGGIFEPAAAIRVNESVNIWCLFFGGASSTPCHPKIKTRAPTNCKKYLHPFRVGVCLSLPVAKALPPMDRILNSDRCNKNNPAHHILPSPFTWDAKRDKREPAQHTSTLPFLLSTLGVICIMEEHQLIGRRCVSIPTTIGRPIVAQPLSNAVHTPGKRRTAFEEFSRPDIWLKTFIKRVWITNGQNCEAYN
jgi:hypothetical protein